VIRFDLKKKKFFDVFVSGADCQCLDRPSGVVFGPDQRLYVANSVLASVNPVDTNNIVIFNGTTVVDTIQLDVPGVRNQPSALLFGPPTQQAPGGLLYVNIVQNGTTGAVFRCNVTTTSKKCADIIVPPNTTLQRPTELTFGSTNPATLVYENND
jgi:hypothetical protein